MLNELYTFAEPVQVVPFSNLKWGKFTLLHTDPKDYAVDIRLKVTTASGEVRVLEKKRLPVEV